MTPHERSAIDRFVLWIGSVPSIIFHSCIFAAFLVLTISNIFPRDLVLLIWNTIVSLEAIYLAIFIQFTVNRHSRELEEVSEDIEGIQEDVEDISEDVEDIQEDIDEIQEDVEEISEDEAEELRKQHQSVTLETMTKDIQRLLKDLEELKRGQ